ncbi:SDR family NAD(P)-dependent oxidoreductase [Chloroflexota bacterium]
MTGISRFSLEGKVAIVTGGKRGIGRAIALAFAEAGADVVVCSRAIGDGDLEVVAEEIQKLGRRSLALQADISKKADVDNLVQRTIGKFDKIDILVNNAAIYKQAPFLEASEAEWDETININLKGYYFCCQAAGKRMVEQKNGNIINLASTSAFKAAKDDGVYSITKAGVVMLTKILALELASYNIRVNAIAPGWVRTLMTEPWFKDPDFLRQAKSETLLGRIAEPDEMSGVALFLASDASSYMTGQTIIVDGGFMS